MSEDEYLSLERVAELRNEYFKDRVYCLTGRTYRHARIVGNLFVQLHQALAGGCYSTTANDVRLRTTDRYYAYPDIMSVCGEIQFTDDHRDTVLNPLLVAEVFSLSTEVADRGSKFSRYRSVDRDISLSQIYGDVILEDVPYSSLNYNVLSSQPNS